MKKLVLLLPIILTACANGPNIQVQEVPVYSCPKVEMQPFPEMYTDRITSQSSYEEIATYYKVDLLTLKEELKSCRSIVETYGKQP